MQDDNANLGPRKKKPLALLRKLLKEGEESGFADYSYQSLLDELNCETSCPVLNATLTG